MLPPPTAKASKQILLTHFFVAPLVHSTRRIGIRLGREPRFALQDTVNLSHMNAQGLAKLQVFASHLELHSKLFV